MSRDGSGQVLTPTGVMSSVAEAHVTLHAVEVPTFDDVYASQVGFVWRVLQTLGVAPPQLEDAVQDVFVVVHRRLAEWEGRAAITTWLFAIARRVASGYRRRAGRPTEPLAPDALDAQGAGDPFAELSRVEAARAVTAILASLDEDQRLVFALVELEQIPVPEVARMLDLKLNTAYSRLRLARHAFEAAVQRRGAR